MIEGTCGQRPDPWLPANVAASCAGRAGQLDRAVGDRRDRPGGTRRGRTRRGPADRTRSSEASTDSCRSPPAYEANSRRRRRAPCASGLSSGSTPAAAQVRREHDRLVEHERAEQAGPAERSHQQGGTAHRVAEADELAVRAGPLDEPGRGRRRVVAVTPPVDRPAGGDGSSTRGHASRGPRCRTGRRARRPSGGRRGRGSRWRERPGAARRSGRRRGGARPRRRRRSTRRTRGLARRGGSRRVSQAVGCAPRTLVTRVACGGATRSRTSGRGRRRGRWR